MTLSQRLLTAAAMIPASEKRAKDALYREAEKAMAEEDRRAMLADLSFEECGDCEGTGAYPKNGAVCIRCHGLGTLEVWSEA